MGAIMWFTSAELNTLMDIMDEIRPIGLTQWEQVERQYNALYPDKTRVLAGEPS